MSAVELAPKLSESLLFPHHNEYLRGWGVGYHARILASHLPDQERIALWHGQHYRAIGEIPVFATQIVPGRKPHETTEWFYGVTKQLGETANTDHLEQYLESAVYSARLFTVALDRLMLVAPLHGVDNREAMIRKIQENLTAS